MYRLGLNLAFLALGAGVAETTCSRTDARQWLAGDTHVHSHWSPGYDRDRARIGRHATYSPHLNAAMARKYGLRWMVTTDHGGANHSKLNLEKAYPELVEARDTIPEVLQFYGTELNMPRMGHHTVIIPHGATEQQTLFELEHGFDVRDVWPVDPQRDTDAARVKALEHMDALPLLPLVFVNHPQRDASSIGRYGINAPWEIRSSNDLAPRVYRGMEGGPGHQAATLNPDGAPDLNHPGHRGRYGNAGAGTLGGYDQMTAIVGGFWDALLGEGRRFWIVATSDSHANYADPRRPGEDFWPGQFHKTYVYARHDYSDVIDGLRGGRVFVVAGDLITELDVTASVTARQTGMGGTLEVGSTDQVRVDIRFRDPDTPNAGNRQPHVKRVDLILGHVDRDTHDPDRDTNHSARVIERFDESTWRRVGNVVSVSTSLPRVDSSIYIRIRGTNTSHLEPAMDRPGEDPWEDLWFYSNPIFIELIPQ